MPQPYTDEILAIEMEQALRSIAKVLGWSRQENDEGEFGDYTPIITDTKILLQTDDLTVFTSLTTDLTDQWAAVKLVQIAERYCMWNHVVSDLATAYDHSSPAGSFTRSQMVKTAQAMLDRATKEALAAGLIKLPSTGNGGSTEPSWTTERPVVDIIGVQYRSPWD